MFLEKPIAKNIEKTCNDENLKLWQFSKKLLPKYFQ